MYNLSEFKNEINGSGGVFRGSFGSATEVIEAMGPERPYNWDTGTRGEISPEHPNYVKLEGLFIVYARYDSEDYEGSAVVFFDRDGVLYETRGSHCSCMGLENTWEEGEVVTVEFLRNLKDSPRESEAYGFKRTYNFGNYDNYDSHIVDVWYSDLMAAIEAYEVAKAQSAPSTGNEV